ncbi:hypothetical protein [Streptomyces paromomycinus]|nr:hypothetical protein [Streptomyces paromomycinus]
MRWEATPGRRARRGGFAPRARTAGHPRKNRDMKPADPAGTTT